MTCIVVFEVELEKGEVPYDALCAISNEFSQFDISTLESQAGESYSMLKSIKIEVRDGQIVKGEG